MASNYTEHYQLPLWEPEDSFLREEFNEANRKIDSTLFTKARIAGGSYVGTGAGGSSSPNELVFEFQPRLVVVSSSIISDTQTIFFPMVAVAGSSQVCSCWDMVNKRGDYCVLTWSENKLSWYSTCLYGGLGSQYNLKGKTYYYLALA